MMKRTFAGTTLALLLAAGATPASAQSAASFGGVPTTAPAATATIGQRSADAAATFYRNRSAPLWFRGGAIDSPGAKMAIERLKLSHLEGDADGPAQAQAVEAALAAARSGDTSALMRADQMLSAAWVQYVTTINSPAPDMEYGEKWLMRPAPRADVILGDLLQSASVEQHVERLSAVNPYYRQLRSAAWAQMADPANTLTARRIAANLARARFVPFTSRYVLVDVPTAKLTMYENGQPMDSMKVVVGKYEYQTPSIASVIYYTVFNPYWHVPDHLIRLTVAPAVLKQGPAYLKARGYQVVSDWVGSSIVDPATVDWKGAAAGTVQVKVRQQPGGSNSMGKMKFPFANATGIYLHDTPMKQYMLKPPAERDLSNGCIRLEDAPRLAKWLFQGRSSVAPNPDVELPVQLPQGVPVYVIYQTVQPVAGKLVATSDPYNKDAGL